MYASEHGCYGLIFDELYVDSFIHDMEPIWTVLDIAPGWRWLRSDGGIV